MTGPEALAILEREGMPPELPWIPRSESHAGTFDNPPLPPAVHRPGRVSPLGERSAMEVATDFLHHANPPLTGHELFVWSMFVAGVPFRRIASQLGVSYNKMLRLYLDPLRARAGLPTTTNYRKDK